MQRINHMLSPKKSSTRCGFLQTITAAVVITAGSLGTVAITDAAVTDDQTSQDRPVNADKAPMKIHDVVLRVTSALTKGDINPAQAAELILAAQQKIKSTNAYADYKQKLIADFKSGKITRKEIGSKLDAHQKQLDTKMIKDFKERINAAVKRGAMSSEEVRQVWGIHKRISKQTSKTITREDYAAAQAEMQAMVDKGEITQAQMDERLMGMRRTIGKSKATGKTITREDYAAAQAEMQAMVDKGEITEDQMNGRLNRMRKMIARGNGNSERREMSDECKELGRRIRTAVENGNMTSEEARKLWEAEGCP